MCANQASRHFAGAHHEKSRGLGRSEIFGAKRRIGSSSPIRNFSAVHDGERTTIPAIEQNKDGLHRRQFTAIDICRKTGDQFARHVPAVIDRVADEILALLAAQNRVLDFDLGPTMRGFQRGNKRGETQVASDVVCAYESHRCSRLEDLRNQPHAHVGKCALGRERQQRRANIQNSQTPEELLICCGRALSPLAGRMPAHRQLSTCSCGPFHGRS